MCSKKFSLFQLRSDRAGCSTGIRFVCRLKRHIAWFGKDHRANLVNEEHRMPVCGG